MKNKFIFALMLLAMVVVITSCATRKYGCPSVSKVSTTKTVNS